MPADVCNAPSLMSGPSRPSVPHPGRSGSVPYLIPFLATARLSRLALREAYHVAVCFHLGYRTPGCCDSVVGPLSGGISGAALVVIAERVTRYVHGSPCR